MLSERASRKTLHFLLVISTVFILLSGLFPVLVITGTVSCTDPAFCWPVEGVFLAFAVLTMSIYRDLRKRTPGLRTTLLIGFLVIAPIAMVLGIFTEILFSPGVLPDRIIDTSRAVLEFDSFLTVGWTIGFNLMGNWLRELRDVRRRIVALREINKQEAEELLRAVQSWTTWSFPEVASSIFLILISAFFAVAGILTGHPTSLLLAVTFLGFGVISMVIAWYDLFLKSQRLSFIVDTAPRGVPVPPAPDPASA